jgi:hypothetical protein
MTVGFCWELLWICRLFFGSIAIFTILVLAFHEYGRPFYLLMSSSMSFFKVLIVEVFHLFSQVYF